MTLLRKRPESFIQSEQDVIAVHIEKTDPRPAVQPAMGVVHRCERGDKVSLVPEMLRIVVI